MLRCTTAKLKKQEALQEMNYLSFEEVKQILQEKVDCVTHCETI